MRYIKQLSLANYSEETKLANSGVYNCAEDRVYSVLRNVSAFLMIAALIVCMMSLPCLAEDAAGTADSSIDTAAITSGVKSGSSQIYGIMTAIVLPLAAVLFAYCGFQILFGGERGMEKAKTRILTLIIAIALIWLAPMIIKEISAWFSSSADTAGVFD